jgi:uncharacterized protein (TIGR00369 family)
MEHMEHMDDERLKRLASFELSVALGIAYEEVSRRQVVATMPVTPLHHQPFGYLHGGVNVFLAETVAGVGAFLFCPPGKAAFGLEINANHMRPVQAGVLRAVARPLHVGRSTQVWEVKISDDQERLVCASRCTLSVVEVGPGLGAPVWQPEASV